MSTIEKALQKQAAVKPATNTVNNADSDKVSTEDSTQLSTQKSKEVKLPKCEIDDARLLQIDFSNLDEKGFVSQTSARKVINEEYRSIKRKLLANAFGGIAQTLQRANVIMVTSARPGEGKTFTSVNLAISIAMEQDKTVLLVDADVLKPNVMKTLGLKNKDGLMEYLLTKSNDIGEFLYKTNMEKLTIVPAGQSHHLSTELLASEKMAQLVEEFATRYNDRVIVIDCPPMLGINETTILANLAGQAVIVTEEGKSRLADIKKAAEQLDSDMAIGFVVNKAVQSPQTGYGYGYYYGAED